MPHDLKTVRQDILLKETHGGNDRVLLTKYEAPAGGDGEIADDPHYNRDQEIARRMMAWLEMRYPGHLWATRADHAQGVVMFNMPILMGLDEWFVVNLSTHEIIDGMRQGAGQILERYRLKRGRFDINTFLEARANHSRLVNPSRKVPN